MTDEEVEVVARALCEAEGDDWFREGPHGLTEAYGPLARAAITALDAYRASLTDTR